MEQYLIDEYDVIEDEKWLTSKDDIEMYFRDGDSRDYFDCGQGYCQDEASVICKIGDKFYQVDIFASICSAKQDYGDRLYWVDGIDKVEYCEIEKPVEKEKMKLEYIVIVNKDQKYALEQFMKEIKVDWRMMK
jgi:hypothetical protein